MITLYDDRCTPCMRKELWKSLKVKTNQHKERLMRLDIRKDAKAKHDANVTYGLPIPFLLVGGKALTVDEYLSNEI